MPIKINELKDIAERVYIIGRGESLQYLRAEDIGDGVVIALNRAIVKVQELNLPNKIFSMQKDGNYKSSCNFDCYHCPLHGVDPKEATLIVNWQSKDCFKNLDRVFIEDHAECGNTRNTSAAVAIRLAKYMGAKEVVMVSFDSFEGILNNYDPLTGRSEFYKPYRSKQKERKELETIRHKFLIPKK